MQQQLLWQWLLQQELSQHPQQHKQLTTFQIEFLNYYDTW
jgi:hypothetical protein